MITERQQFFNGQRLFADDLQGIDDFNAQMRWLHNQSLHQPGVGSGYAIYGPKGAREVTIQPGYAIDSAGREIVLTEPTVQAIPPVAGDGQGNSVFYDLTVSYPSDTDLVATQTRAGICAPTGVIRRREAPVFCWLRIDQLQPDTLKDLEAGARIRLGRAEVLNCQLAQPISFAQRRNARPTTRPYVASGRTDSSGWAAPKTSVAGIELTMPVDTSAACFRTPPCYMARLAGNRHFQISLGPGGGTLDVFLDGFVAVANASIKRFDVSILIPLALVGTRTADVVAALPQALKTNQWGVEWVGVEG